MKIRRFYLETGFADHETLVISGDEHFHLKNVLRFKSGEVVEAFDGFGQLYRGTLSEVGVNSTTVRITDRISIQKPPVKTIIAVSILKRKAMLSLIENLSEVGIDEIIPVTFSRTDTDFKEKSLEKWNKLARMSLKVNGNLWPSKICSPLTFKEFLGYSEGFENKIILDLEGKRDFCFKKVLPALVVIGPPGDFTPDERKTLVENGFCPVRINDCILRSEVAALSISAILKTYA